MTNWIWPIAAIIGVFVVFEIAVIYWGRFLADLWVGWKNQVAAWGTIFLGLIIQIEPSLFTPLFGESKYTGLVIAMLGIVFKVLREVTFEPGSRVPQPVAAASAAQTLTKTSKPELEDAAVRLENKPQDTKAAEAVVETAIKTKTRRK